MERLVGSSGKAGGCRVLDPFLLVVVRLISAGAF